MADVHMHLPKSVVLMGLFVGAVILSIGYKLLRAWLDELSHPDEGAN